MEKIKRKEHLKKLMFVQHIIIIAITCIAIGLLIKSTSAREEP
jgi:Na+/proline symporter